MATYYVTKWVLTRGILELDGKLTEDGKYVLVALPGGALRNAISYGKGAFERRVEAERYAKGILTRRIAATNKILVRLKKQLTEMG